MFFYWHVICNSIPRYLGCLETHQDLGGKMKILEMTIGVGVWVGIVTFPVHAEDSHSHTMVHSAWSSPANADKIINPITDQAGALEAGKALYAQSCVACHGSKGEGNGPAAPFLDKHPGVLSDPMMWTHSDGSLFWKVTNGNTPMPSFKDALTETQRWQVLTYIRTLAAKPADYVAAAPNSTTTSATIITKPTATESENLQAMENLERTLDETKRMAKDAYPGTTKMIIVGYGTAGFTGKKSGDGAMKPLYSASFNPLMIWKLSDQLLFEGEVELQMEGTATTVNLEVAQSSYILNDYMTFGAGKFLNPMNFFVERQHMNWVNKMVDKPLAVYDGLLMESDVGTQLRGVLPLSTMKLEYAVFAVNAPMLITEDSTALGSFEYNDFDNVNGNIAFGGHVGFIPHHQVEIGYGLQTSEVTGPGSSIRALMQSADFNYVEDAEAILGNLSLRGQWVWSQVDKLTYDADKALRFGPVNFDNYRNGGYAQLAYRPSKIKVPILADIEPVVRWDALYQKKIPGGHDETRFAFGLNYWIKSNVVLKGTYEFDDTGSGAGKSNLLMAQFISGF